MVLAGFILRRSAAAIVVLVGLSILIFVVARIIPGDPARMALGSVATPEQVEKLRHRLHLDESLPVQYWEFIKGLARGDFGESLVTRRSVSLDLVDTFPATLELVLAAGLIMVLVGVPLGIIAARYRDTAIDNIARLLALLGVVTPSFVWAVFLMLLLSFVLGLLPVAGRLSKAFDPPPIVSGMYTFDALIAGQWRAFWDAIQHLILPALALALAGMGQAARLTRTNMAEIYGRQYIEMARAFAFREHEIALKYAPPSRDDPDTHDPRPRFRGDAGQRLPGGGRVRLARHGQIRRLRNPAEGPQRHRRHGARHRRDVPHRQHHRRYVDRLHQSADPAREADGMRRLFHSRAWYKFSRSRLSVFGLLTILAIALATIVAPLIAPYPEHVGIFVDFRNTEQPPGWLYFFGTDDNGRDIFSRVLYAYRVSFAIGLLVLTLAVPVGIVLGLLAGYYGGLVDTIIMRTTDVFLALPPLVLAMAIMGYLKPSLFNIMIAISVMWWPWHARLIYSLTRSLRHEGYVKAAKVAGGSDLHILFKEILPNCVPSLLTKMAFDMSFVILMIAALGFVGLGMQPPTPDLGRMVAEGVKFMPFDWWMSVFPGLAILILVLAFNLFGDGLRDMLDVDV